jgi:hypothetical protein
VLVGPTEVLCCAEDPAMHKLRLVVATLAVSASLMGMTMMGIAGLFLRGLDDRAFGDPVQFYASLRHYGALGWNGALVALGGCVGLALLLDWKKNFQAAKICGAVAFLSLTVGLYVFPIHFPSGAMYFSLLTFTSGACIAFALAATVRYMWGRTRRSSERAAHNGHSC